MWWSVTANYKAVHPDEKRRRHLWERIVFLAQAADEESARKLGASIAKSKEHSYKSGNGDYVKWQFIELLDVKELFDQQITSGTEVDWKFFERVDMLKEKSSN